MIIGQEDEGSYALRLSRSVLFKRLTGHVWYYRADDNDMVVAVETNRLSLEGSQRVMSLDKFTPLLSESEMYNLFRCRLDQIELAHGAYWNSQLWC